MNTPDTLRVVSSVGEYTELGELKYASTVHSVVLPHITTIIARSTHRWSVNREVIFEGVAGYNNTIISDGIKYRVTRDYVARTVYRCGRPLGIHISHENHHYHDPPKFSYLRDTLPLFRGRIFAGLDIRIKEKFMDDMFKSSDRDEYVYGATSLTDAFRAWRKSRGEYKRSYGPYHKRVMYCFPNPAEQ